MTARRAPRLRRLGYLPIAAAAATLLFMTMSGTASGAGAGGELKYVTQSKAVPSKDIGRTHAFVDCPSSHPNVTGGGMEFTNGIQDPLKGSQDPLDLEVADTFANGGGDEWIASANNNTGFPSHMTGTAICAKGRFVYKSEFGNIPGRGQGVLRVFCPPGTQLSGGGVETGSTLPQVAVASSEPIDGPDSNSKRDDGWFGVGGNTRPGSVSMSVEAVCARSGSYKYVESPKSTVPDNTQGSDGVACPQGTQVSGGGVDITGESVGIEVGGTFPSDRGDVGVVPDDGWDAVANNDDTGHAEKMQVFGICRA
jgi:hypothetical protein